MKTRNSCRNGLRWKSGFASFWARYKTIIIILSLFFIMGLIIGIFTASKFSKDLTVENLLDQALCKLISGDKSSFGWWFSQILIFAVMCSIIIFLNFSPWMMIFTFCTISFYGYFIGFNITCLIVIHPFGGLITALLVLIPFYLILATLLIIMAAVAIHRSFLIKKFGINYVRSCYRVKFGRIYAFLFFLIVLVLFIQSLLLRIVNVTIIVV